MNKNKLTPLWHHDQKDESTWKYLDCEIGGEKGKRFIRRWIINCNFKYKHLDPSYPKSLDE